nr:hypothetical protein [Amycolatopsis vastitatis]
MVDLLDREPAEGHRGADDEFGEVVAERCESQVVEVDDRDPVVGAKEVADVGVLVERDGEFRDRERQVLQGRGAGCDEVGDHQPGCGVRLVERRAVEGLGMRGSVDPSKRSSGRVEVRGPEVPVAEVLEHEPAGLDRVQLRYAHSGVKSGQSPPVGCGGSCGVLVLIVLDERLGGHGRTAWT